MRFQKEQTHKRNKKQHTISRTEHHIHFHITRDTIRRLNIGPRAGYHLASMRVNPLPPAFLFLTNLGLSIPGWCWTCTIDFVLFRAVVDPVLFCLLVLTVVWSCQQLARSNAPLCVGLIIVLNWI